jgi:predicted CXXCH cytochrome family protein
MRHTRPIILGLLLLLLQVTLLPAQSIVDTPHNLSVTGPGNVRAISEERVCIFCHTPHGARTVAPLWNRRDSASFYLPYDSPTITAKPGQPTGSSKLCLSCHDGTIALGDLVSESAPVAMAGSPVMPPGGSRIGTDLRDDHPISFSYAQSLSRPQGELAFPHTWDPAIKLDANGLLQCTTCHDPHDNTWQKFLVMDNTAAALCRECHRIDEFENTAHALSTNTWRGGGTNPWAHTENTDVATNSCLNCHRSHHAPGKEGLLTAVRDEDVCLNCHNGSVADANVAVAFRKPYRHPVMETSGGHQGGEMLTGRADHVTCVDCHNPHKAEASREDPPFVTGLLKGVTGMNESGLFVSEAMYEYEVCFKCHAEEDSQSIQAINRQIPSAGMRRQFGNGSPSFHPVVSQGMNSYVPSLIAPLTESSQIACTDCHGDDTPSSTTLEQSRAPHGSRHRHLLSREYRTGDNISESQAAYSLCYSCHDRSSLLANESFAGHRQHIVNERISCAVCHDAHGIDSMIGNSVNNANLINFDMSVVQPLPSSGVLEYTSSGPQSGSCTLRCHNRDHDNMAY